MQIIQKNVELIKNPYSVNCIYVYKKNDKRCLLANINNGQTIQLTEIESFKTFPYEALKEFAIYAKLDKTYFNNFAIIEFKGLALNCCVNKENVIDFSYDPNEIQKGVDITANFINAINVRILGVKPYVYEKLKIECLDKILNEKKQNKEDAHEPY